MLELVSFSLFQKRTDLRGGRGNDLPSEVFAECIARWPDFKRRGKAAFSVEAPRDSEVLHEILEFLEQHGLRANWNRFPSVGYRETDRFQLTGRREFERKEIDDAKYVWCIPEQDISKDGYRNDEGTIDVKRGGLYKKDFGSTATGFNLLCTDSCKTAMENEGFTNLTFESVSVIGEKPPIEKIWEVVSNVALPPVTNQTVNQDGNEPDRSKLGCWINDLYFPPIPRFEGSAVAASLPYFDVALTEERWHAGPYERRNAWTICSQRFRSWLTSQKYHCRFVPVIFEESSA